MESLRALRQLVTLAETGNYRKAAAKLGITHSALSQAVKRLEDVYGVSIFVRLGGKIVPSAYGELLVGTARRSLEQFRELEREIGLIKSSETGRIAIGVDPCYSQAVVAPALGRMIVRFPKLRFTLRLQSWAEMQDGLADHHIDIYVGPSPDREIDGIDVVVLPAPPPVVVCRAGHPLTEAVAPTFTDLLAYPIASGVPKEQFLERVRGMFPEPRPSLQSISDMFLKSYDCSVLPGIVVNSDAVGLMPCQVIEPELADGRAVCIKLADDILRDVGNIVVAKLKDRVMPKAALILQSEIMAELGADPKQASAPANALSAAE